MPTPGIDTVPDYLSELCLLACRDVKPENMLVSLNESSVAGGRPEKFHLRLIDMGSAVDKESIMRMYGADGPSEREQTHKYAPPEALLGK